VILDDIAASQASLRKAYLLHTTQKPSVDGRLLTARDGEGVLYQWTLAPKEATLTLIGGPGKEFWVNGANYPPSRAPRGKEQPGAWRVEVSPVKKSAADKFLHVLFPTDAGSVAPKEPPAFALGGMQGCIVGDWIIFFESGNAVETLAYDAALATSRHLISGAAPLAKYDLYVDGDFQDTLTASFAGVLRFDLDAPGRVRLEPKI
jgi:hypothetical protein